MRSSMNRPGSRLTALALGALVVGAGAACSPDRLRPGPPSLVIEVPEGNTVTSPDTMPMRVYVRDDNGLDSVTVSLRDLTVEINAFDRVEYADIIEWPIPEGLLPGDLLTFIGYAKDLVGERTSITTTVTVVAPPVAAR